MIAVRCAGSQYQESTEVEGRFVTEDPLLGREGDWVDCERR